MQCVFHSFSLCFCLHFWFDDLLWCFSHFLVCLFHISALDLGFMVTMRFVRLCLVAQSCWPCDPMHCSLLGSSVHGDYPGKNIGVGFMPSSRGSSQLVTEARSPTLQADSLLFEPLGKLKKWSLYNTEII